MFLNQLLEEYKQSKNPELYDQFIKRLWSSKYGFRKYKKHFSYIVDHNALGNNQELIDLFNTYSKIEYDVCRSFYKKRLEHIDYIRIHINNMFGKMFDNDVYYDKQYYKTLIVPKREYFNAIRKIRNSEEIDIDSIKNTIEESLFETEKIKSNSIRSKGNLKWSQYKILIEGFILSIFGNFTPIHEYEENHGWEMRVDVDGWSEDNYVVKYFCKSLTGYLKDHRRHSLGFKKRDKLTRCVNCYSLIIKPSNRKKYCNDCWTQHRNNYQKELMRERRE